MKPVFPPLAVSCFALVIFVAPLWAGASKPSHRKPDAESPAKITGEKAKEPLPKADALILPAEGDASRTDKSSAAGATAPLKLLAENPAAPVATPSPTPFAVENNIVKPAADGAGKASGASDGPALQPAGAAVNAKETPAPAFSLVPASGGAITTGTSGAVTAGRESSNAAKDGAPKTGEKKPE